MQNHLDDMDYFYQQCFSIMHILPRDVDEEDFNELTRILNAKKPEDRVQDPLALMNSIRGNKK